MTVVIHVLTRFQRFCAANPLKAMTKFGLEASDLSP